MFMVLTVKPYVAVYHVSQGIADGICHTANLNFPLGCIQAHTI
jgi:hypothetical protein